MSHDSTAPAGNRLATTAPVPSEHACTKDAVFELLHFFARQPSTQNLCSAIAKGNIKTVAL
jgi:hypothetical protein